MSEKEASSCAELWELRSYFVRKTPKTRVKNAVIER